MHELAEGLAAGLEVRELVEARASRAEEDDVARLRRLGGVDEQLIRNGRLRPLTDPRALDLHKRDADESSRVRREPQLMLDLLLSALEA